MLREAAELDSYFEIGPGEARLLWGELMRLKEYHMKTARRLREAQRVVIGAVRAKREIGLRGKEMKLRFFEDIWPEARDALLEKRRRVSASGERQ